MNDFTKTDLIEIYRCLKYMTKEGVTPYSCHTISLCKKVHNMIDNYCEHENDERFCMMPLPGIPKMCTKCQGFYL